ncbi:MAG: hypothetical protein ACR2NX_13025 [Chthoniobacterales bacterium]
MSGKYDPPNKADLIAESRRTPCVPELAVAAAEGQFPPKVQQDDAASRARLAAEEESLAQAQARAVGTQPLKRGRKPVVTASRVEIICKLLAHGETECAACLRAGIGLTAWNAKKRRHSSLRDRIASARDDWARLRAAQHAAALYESQVARSAGQKALKPHPTKQVKMIFWHLVKRVPLYFVAIPEGEINSACERFGITSETWRRQERAFSLMQKVYEKRATIRGSYRPAN